MKKTLVFLLIALLTLTALPALAASGSVDLNELPGYQDGTIPSRIPEPGAAIYLADTYPSWTLVDYISYPGLTDRSYAFALLEKDGQRLLIGFRSAADDSASTNRYFYVNRSVSDSSPAMHYWFRVKDAVPQGEGHAAFVRDTDGWFITDELSRPLLTVRLDSPDSPYYDSVTYAWNGSTFLLTGWTRKSLLAEVEGDKVTLYEAQWTDSDPSLPWQWERLGSASGTLQRDVRYVSYETLPRSLADARAKLNDPPRIPTGDLTTVDVHFTGHEQYDVHSGPGDHYLRGANGHAVVSTNGWIQVFGQQDGWVMIQYAINDDQYRIGWIRSVSLPEDAYVPTLYFDETPMRLTTSATLTDDPLNSRHTLAHLHAGNVTHLADLGSYAYIEAEVAGKPVRGFVPQSMLAEIDEK